MGASRGIDHVGAEVIDAVDRLVHGAFVAGDRGGGEDHRVPFVQRDVGVVEVGHAAQGDRGSPWLPVEMTTESMVGSPRSPWVRPAAVGDVDVAELAADIHVLAHRAAHQRDLAAELRGGVDHLLHAVDVRGEAGDHDPPLAACEHLLEFGATDDSDGDIPGRSALVESAQRSSSRHGPAPPAATRLPGAVDRRLVELIVAGHEGGPSSQVRATANESGIECAIFTISAENGPASKVCVARTSCSGASWSLCSSSLERAIATVSGPP